MKSWSYEEITEKAESEIKRFMASDNLFINDCAYGIFRFWQELTMGFQKDGDVERVESLTIKAGKASHDRT